MQVTGGKLTQTGTFWAHNSETYMVCKQELSMRSIVRFFIAEAVVVAVAVALISSAYIFILPRYFDDRRTYSVLIGGLVIAAVASAYVARQWLAGRSWGWSLTLAISGIVTIATLLLSLFLIVNSRGS